MMKFVILSQINPDQHRTKYQHASNSMHGIAGSSTTVTIFPFDGGRTWKGKKIRAI